MQNLDDRVAIVTGASRGIGAAAARKLGQAGAAVMVSARNGDMASAVAENIVDAGGEAAAMSCDVSDFTAVGRRGAATPPRRGAGNVLVHTARGIEPLGALAETDPDAWAESIRINLIGAYNCIRAVLPNMIAAGHGTIINISSGAAHRPLQGWSAYCAGKAGLAILTDAIQLEAGNAGIRVFGLSPGTIDTDMQVAIRGSGINPVSQIPRSNLAPVAHPAVAIAYLCTVEADDLRGQEVSLNDPKFRARLGLV